MARKLVLIAVVAAFALAATATAHVTNVLTEQGQLVETGPSNYALQSQSLRQMGILTAARNGDTAVIISANCQVREANWNQLSDAERTLIDAARAQLSPLTQNNNGMVISGFHNVVIDNGVFISGNNNINNNNVNFNNNNEVYINGQRVQPSTGYVQYSSGTYSSYISPSISNTYNSNNFQSTENGVSVVYNDDDNFTLAKETLPSDAIRVLVYAQHMAAVYRNGQVHMRPIACINQDEHRFIASLREEIKQMRARFDEQMRKMAEDLKPENMFGNQWPFGPVNNPFGRR